MKIRINGKVFVFLGIFILGIGVGIGGMFLKERFFPADGTNSVTQKKQAEIGPLIELEEFLINLDDGGAIRAVITIEGINSKSEEKIRAKEIFIRDRILTVLGAKGIDDVRTDNRDKLKDELIIELNDVCNDEINDVLFKNFVYQRY